MHIDFASSNVKIWITFLCLHFHSISWSLVRTSIEAHRNGPAHSTCTNSTLGYRACSNCCQETQQFHYLNQTTSFNKAFKNLKTAKQFLNLGCWGLYLVASEFFYHYKNIVSMHHFTQTGPGLRRHVYIKSVLYTNSSCCDWYFKFERIWIGRGPIPVENH